MGRKKRTIHGEKKRIDKEPACRELQGASNQRIFDKITIKMITDQAGVIRPTFYNYFQDKYEVMEWLLETEVFRHAREMMEDGMEKEAIYLLFRKMEKTGSII